MLLRAPGFSALHVANLRHGFTTREGGVSEGSFASLNVSAKRGDDPARVEENLCRIADEGDFSRERLRRVRQVHGCSVLRASTIEPESEADAIWTHIDDGPCIVSVTTADCVPILLTDVGGRVAAAVHSGWRGTVANIVGATVETLLAQGVRPSELRAAIGPCIYLPAFEVGEEVAEHFNPRYVAREGYANPHVDLPRLVRDQLLEAGLDADAVEVVGACTHRHPERFFSYRRDGASTGQALSFVGFAD